LENNANIKMIKLSFIVPFYNVEKYIGACLDSLYAQDIPEEEYEVICVDDCSPDNSKSIVIQYQKKYKNLILIEHENNKGLGASRNTGLNAARGEYVWFVDSDDFVSINAVSKLISYAETYSPDVILFNYQRVSEIGKVIDKGLVFENSELLSGKEFVNTFFGESFIYHLGYVWRCVYSTRYLKQNNLLFPEKVFWEDTVFFPKTILYADKVISIEDIFYNYRVNDESISGSKNSQKANRYFQFSFVAGLDLFEFAKNYMEVDQGLGSVFRKKAEWYFNSFTKPFVNSSFREKLNFYRYIKESKKQINEISDSILWFNKILMIPAIGLTSSFVFKFAYRIKKIKK